MAIDRETLARLAPGYEVAVVEKEFEGTPYEVLELRAGEETLVQVNPGSGAIRAITIMSASIESDTGVAVGTSFAAASAAMGPFSCELSYHDSMYPEQPNCTPAAAPDWIVVFTSIEAPDLAEGDEIPDERLDTLLGQAVVEAIDIQ
jgi:hypothetical protein